MRRAQPEEPTGGGGGHAGASVGEVAAGRTATIGGHQHARPVAAGGRQFDHYCVFFCGLTFVKVSALDTSHDMLEYAVGYLKLCYV